MGDSRSGFRCSLDFESDNVVCNSREPVLSEILSVKDQCSSIDFDRESNPNLAEACDVLMRSAREGHTGVTERSITYRKGKRDMKGRLISIDDSHHLFCSTYGDKSFCLSMQGNRYEDSLKGMYAKADVTLTRVWGGRRNVYDLEVQR